MSAWRLGDRSTEQIKIHIYPLVTLITWDISGMLQIKDPEHDESYVVVFEAQQAALNKPQTFLQYINVVDELCRVPYIVSPAYVFLMEMDGTVTHDEVVVTVLDLEELTQQQWHIPGISDHNRIRTN